ncbi:MAG: hypothetical protein RIT02_4205, partial [Planctomycetota bacterium]
TNRSAQQELRPPTIAIKTSGNAVCSGAQDFALIQKTDHRPPTTDHRPLTTDHRPLTTDH